MNTFSDAVAVVTAARAIVPLYRHHLSAGPYTVEVIAYGKPHNWSLSLLNHPSSQEAEELRDRLKSIFTELELTTVFALSPDFTRRTIDRTAFGAYEWIGNTAFHRNSCAGGDAFGIEPGEAVIITPANCATVAGINPSGKCFVAHAGTNCLVNAEGLRKAIATRSPVKDVVHESVMDSVLNELGFYAHIGIFGAVPPEHYPFRLTDKIYGSWNEALLLYLQHHNWGAALQHHAKQQAHCFNAAELIRRQCGTRGITIADSDVFTANPEKMFLNPQVPQRNLVIVHALPGRHGV